LVVIPQRSGGICCLGADTPSKTPFQHLDKRDFISGFVIAHAKPLKLLSTARLKEVRNRGSGWGR